METPAFIGVFEGAGKGSKGSKGFLGKRGVFVL